MFEILDRREWGRRSSGLGEGFSVVLVWLRKEVCDFVIGLFVVLGSWRLVFV